MIPRRKTRIMERRLKVDRGVKMATGYEHCSATANPRFDKPTMVFY